MASDPRRKRGRFEFLLNDIQACKAAKTCPLLNIRQFYFEPNRSTFSSWKNEGLFLEGIDHRVVFVCESPGPSAVERSAEDIELCFHGSPRDRRFREARRKYGFESYYITNTVKCGVRQGAQHTGLEIETCSRFLVREIHLIKPQVLVGVGGNAFRTLRTDTLMRLKAPPILFQITHYSSRRNPWKFWDKEFPELLRLLARLRPPGEW